MQKGYAAAGRPWGNNSPCTHRHTVGTAGTNNSMSLWFRAEPSIGKLEHKKAAVSWCDDEAIHEGEGGWTKYQASVLLLHACLARQVALLARLLIAQQKARREIHICDN